MSSQKLTLICQEMPFPANHGGVVDMLRRIQTLSRLGVQLLIVCWHHDPRSTVAQDSVEVLRKYAREVIVLPYRRGLFQRLSIFSKYLQYPAPVCSRWISSAEEQMVAERIIAFAPQFIMQDGLMSGYLSRKMSDALNIPLLVRSHNIEHLYWRKQLKLAKPGLDWIKCFFRLTGVYRFEVQGLKKAYRFFDISSDDLQYWTSQGFNNGTLLPPLVDFSSAEETNLLSNQEPFDLVFVGNLRMPNNVDAVCWLVDLVVPHFEQTYGRKLKVLIAGSAPTATIVAMANSNKFSLLANFSSLAEVLAQGRLLVNPMQDGSGVALKTVDMLMTGKCVLSTRQGVAGLPDEVKSCVVIADDVAHFSANIFHFLNETDNTERAEHQKQIARTVFGDGALAPLLSVLNEQVVI